MKTNKWEVLTPKGDAMLKPPYCVGKGYYDPTYNVYVVQCAYTNKMWIYRHKNATAETKTAVNQEKPATEVR